MKYKIAPALAFTAIAVSQLSAHAQTSVTIYGLVEAGGIHITNAGGSALQTAVTGRSNGSRLGFRGSEDLGDGYAVSFILEQGIDTSKGTFLQGGLPWGRMAVIALRGPFGEIGAGRQTNATIDYLFPLASTSSWAWTGSHPGDFDNLMSGYYNNSIKYVSPRFNGLQMTALLGLGEQSGSSSKSSLRSIGAQYQEGNLRAAFVYESNNNPSRTIFGGATSPGETGYASPVRNPVYRGYASAQTQKILGAGASYRFGMAQVGATYTHTTFENILQTASTPHGGDARLKNYELNARYRTGAVDLGAAVDYTQAPSAKYVQLRAGPTYWFSKRTDLQLVYVHQRASGIDSTGKAALANISPVGVSSTNTQGMLKIALRHRF